MGIPKIIHYCWFGGSPKNDKIRQCMASWEKYASDYEIREWNESNFNIESGCAYVKEAYQRKKWAFVTDYVRLCALYQNGGIYLDTDVEIIKSFDPLLSSDAFIGAESMYSMCTATIGAIPQSAFIGRIMELYKSRRFVRADGSTDETPNSQLIYKMLADSDDYRACSVPFQAKDCVIYPADYFSPLNCYTLKTKKTENTYSIHYCAGTWKSPTARTKDRLEAGVTRIIGETNRERLKRLIKGSEQ